MPLATGAASTNGSLIINAGCYGEQISKEALCACGYERGSMMENYYEKWLAREREWMKEAKKKSRKTTLLMIAAVVAALPLISIISGLAGGAEKFWSGVPASLLIGLCIGAFVWLFTCCTNPVKRYEKIIQKVMTEEVSETERESFARQMLGEDPDSAVREVAWKSMNAGQNLARVTKDYLTFADDRGNFRLVQLWKTERMELDVRDASYRVRTNGMSFRISDEFYSVGFFYKGSVNGAKQESDTGFSFEKRAWRDEVVQAIREVAGDFGV